MTASHASHAPSSLLLLPLLLLLLLPSCSGSLATHRYLPDERVNLYVNKIGPYNNPLETYPYYSLPYCHPVDGHETNKHKQGISLGETLEGHSLRESGFHIFFAKDVQVEELCTMTLKDHDVKLFNKAVRQQYFYQMYIDDLPVWGMVGESHASIDKAAAASNPSSNNTNHVTNYLFTKRHIALEYNGDRIITVNMTNDGLEPIVVGHEVTFEMIVSWTRTEGEFHNRFER
jgi:transmembrane 9 superfamily member 3